MEATEKAKHIFLCPIHFPHTLAVAVIIKEV
jgi:hypothetical protein